VLKVSCFPHQLSNFAKNLHQSAGLMKAISDWLSYSGCNTNHKNAQSQAQCFIGNK
jgi:hypothetical protein